MLQEWNLEFREPKSFIMDSNIPVLVQRKALSLSSEAVCHTNVLEKIGTKAASASAHKMYRNTGDPGRIFPQQ